MISTVRPQRRFSSVASCMDGTATASGLSTMCSCRDDVVVGGGALVGREVTGGGATATVVVVAGTRVGTVVGPGGSAAGG